MREERWKSRGRSLVFTQKDEAILSEALRTEFPQIVFLDGQSWLAGTPRAIYGIEQSEGVTAAVPVPDGFGSPEDVHTLPRSGPDICVRARGRALVIVRSSWEWRPGRSEEEDRRFAFDPPTLGSGQVGARWDSNDRSSADVDAFLRRVWRILGRLSTNRVKHGTPLMNQLTSGSDYRRMAEVRGGMSWAGHHALQWCAAGGSRRMLDGCFRPCDDWAPPQDPWYQALKRKVEERYGADFGNPPPEPPG